MADSPFPSKASEKRTSLAEMAARAAQRTSRPPPAPSTPPSSRNPASMAPRGAAGSYAPPPASFPPPQSYAPPAFGASASTDANGSGLINLNHISQAPTLAPAVRPIDPRSVTPATPVGTQAVRASNSGSRMVLAGVVVALVGIGVAYGLTSQNGSDAPSERAAAVAEAPAPMQANAVGVAPPSQPTAAAAPAPVAAAEKATVNTPPSGTIAPAEATEITRAAVAHAPARPGKGRKPAAASNGNVAAATGPSPGAAAIAAAVAAEAPPAAPAPAAHPPAAAAAPAAPAAPEPTGLVGAIKKAVGPTEPTSGPEKAAPPPPPIRGDIPDRPAQGAVTGALGAPRAAARNCLVGQDAPSRATVVFASTGKVQGVTVSGPAAGTPAAECIKTALSKTVVGAFKEATSSITVTITPP